VSGWRSSDSLLALRVGTGDIEGEHRMEVMERMVAIVVVAGAAEESRLTMLRERKVQTLRPSAQMRSQQRNKPVIPPSSNRGYAA